MTTILWDINPQTSLMSRKTLTIIYQTMLFIYLLCLCHLYIYNLFWDVHLFHYFLSKNITFYLHYLVYFLLTCRAGYLSRKILCIRWGAISCITSLVEFWEVNKRRLKSAHTQTLKWFDIDLPWSMNFISCCWFLLLVLFFASDLTLRYRIFHKHWIWT